MPVKRQVTRQIICFLDVYFEEAAGDCVKAAELAGYAHPKVAGYKLRQKYSDLLGTKRLEHRAKVEMSEEEWMATVTAVARDPSHRHWRAAAEMIGRAHGQLSEKLMIIDHKVALAEVKQLAVRIRDGEVADEDAKPNRLN